MVRLDDMRLTGLAAGRLNDIRVNRTLRKPPDTLKPLRFRLKDRNKFIPTTPLQWRDPYHSNRGTGEKSVCNINQRKSTGV